MVYSEDKMRLLHYIPTVEDRIECKSDDACRLRNITMPLLNVMAETDHLVPNEASIPLTDAVSSTDKETLIFPTGHIGIFVGSKSQKEVVPKIAAWLKPRSG